MRNDEIPAAIYSAMKAAAWERAKGELRALVAMQGSVPSTDTASRWDEAGARIEKFITRFEDDGLHE